MCTAAYRLNQRTQMQMFNTILSDIRFIHSAARSTHGLCETIKENSLVIFIAFKWSSSVLLPALTKLNRATVLKGSVCVACDK